MDKATYYTDLAVAVGSVLAVTVICIAVSTSVNMVRVDAMW